MKLTSKLFICVWLVFFAIIICFVQLATMFEELFHLDAFYSCTVVREALPIPLPSSCSGVSMGELFQYGIPIDVVEDYSDEGEKNTSSIAFLQKKLEGYCLQKYAPMLHSVSQLRSENITIPYVGKVSLFRISIELLPEEVQQYQHQKRRPFRKYHAVSWSATVRTRQVVLQIAACGFLFLMLVPLVAPMTFFMKGTCSSNFGIYCDIVLNPLKSRKRRVWCSIFFGACWVVTVLEIVLVDQAWSTYFSGTFFPASPPAARQFSKSRVYTWCMIVNAAVLIHCLVFAVALLRFLTRDAELVSWGESVRRTTEHSSTRRAGGVDTSRYGFTSISRQDTEELVNELQQNLLMQQPQPRGGRTYDNHRLDRPPHFQELSADEISSLSYHVNMMMAPPHPADLEEGEKECIICLTNAADTMFLPCSHHCVCGHCAQKLFDQQGVVAKCPLCRERIRELGPALTREATYVADR